MKGYKIYLIIGCIFILGYLLAQYNKPTPTDWTPTYSSKDKIPFGTFILYNRLKDLAPKATVKQSHAAAYNTFKNQSYQNTAYLIVAKKTDLNSYDFQQMKKFMQAGNQVFIATYDLGKYLNKQLKVETFPVFSGGEHAANLTNPALKSVVNYGFEKGIGSPFFSKIDTSKATVLGINGNGKPNFIRYDFGKGALYLITDPGFYTNFNLLDKYGAEYAAKTLSYLQGSKYLIYDEYFANKEAVGTDILRVFFQHPELKWAYTICIISLLLFVLYDMKRRQRIIPVADPLQNSSVEFVRVVGSVYYQEKNHLDIALKKINYFLAHLRSQYFMKTNEIDAQFTEVLIQKTGIHPALAKTLTNQLRDIPRMAALSQGQLISLNESIEHFYKNTKRHGAGTV